MKELLNKYYAITRIVASKAISTVVCKDDLTEIDRASMVEYAIDLLKKSDYLITQDEIKECSIKELRTAQFKYVDEPNETGKVLMLVPTVLVPFLPSDMVVHPINKSYDDSLLEGAGVSLEKADKSQNFGCIAYGIWIQSNIHAHRPSDVLAVDWTKDILINELTINIHALKVAANVNCIPKLAPGLFGLRQELKALLEVVESEDDTNLKHHVSRYLRLLGISKESDVLKKNLDIAQNKLSVLSQKFLKETHGVDIQDLTVSKTEAQGIYNDSPITINVRMYNGVSYGENYISFYSDDIPELNLPVKMHTYDNTEVRRAYIEYTTAYDNWTYRDVVNSIEDESDDEEFSDFKHYMDNEIDDDEDRGQSL